MERFDVAVVGGRVAGSAVAIQLRRAGLSVVVLERSSLPSDTLSTHGIQDLPAFERLGVLDALLHTKAPPMTRSVIVMNELDLSVDHPELPWLCIRRVTLDDILSRHARDAGAEVRFDRPVADLVTEHDRVVGVRLKNGAEVRATLVIGADGRNSSVARLVGARHYNVTNNERAAVWRYYSRADMPPEFHFHRLGRELFLASPCDYGLTLIAAQPAIAEARRYFGDGHLEEEFERHCPQLDGCLSGAEPAGDLHRMLRFNCFFRESAGPGWVLLGDAGHVKDVVTGQGICDAIRQGEALAVHILAGWGNAAALDRSLRCWWRWRDRDAAPMYWYSQDLGREGELSALHQALLRTIGRSHRAKYDMREILTHRLSPRRIVTVRRAVSTVGELRRTERSMGSALRHVREGLALEVRRAHLAFRPRYADAPQRVTAPISAATGAVRNDGGTPVGTGRDGKEHSETFAADEGR